MFSIKIDVTGAVAGINERLDELRNNDILRDAALTLLGTMHDRIHQDGKAADGNQIGTYSPAYMRYRTGNFRNSGKISKGKSKGKSKDAGVYTKGKNKGEPRQEFKRTADTKIIVSLTRQLENDWAVIATPKGWGIGFNNPYNLQKMQWVEKRKEKKIGAPTPQEREDTIDLVRRGINDILNK